MPVSVLESKYAHKGWYPATPGELIPIITKHYTQPKDNVRAVIAPHAGYAYCGDTFSKGMSRIDPDKTYDKVFIIGPSHYHNIHNKAYVCDTYKWISTTLDTCEVDTVTSKHLGDQEHFELDPEVLYPEHSIQLHVPFIQHTLPGIPIVPIIVGKMDQAVEHIIANTIKSVATDNSLFMISSDFTHYGEKFNYTPYKDHVDTRQQIHDFDKHVIDLILNGSYQDYRDHINNTHNTVCGRHAISLLLNILSNENTVREEQDYSMSGDLSGDYSNSVSYASITFTI